MNEPFRRPYPRWLDKLPEEIRDEAIEAYHGRFSTDLQPVIDNQVTVVVGPPQQPPPSIVEEEPE